jgi:hypothetical protein
MGRSETRRQLWVADHAMLKAPGSSTVTTDCKVLPPSIILKRLRGSYGAPAREGGAEPVERHALAGVFLERVAIGGDALFEACGAALAPAERLERSAEIVLGRFPVERHALAGLFHEGVAVGGDGLFEAFGAALAPAERQERIAEIGLGCRARDRLSRQVVATIDGRPRQAGCRYTISDQTPRPAAGGGGFGDGPISDSRAAK